MEPLEIEYEEEVVQIYDAGELKFYERRATSGTEESISISSPRIMKGKSSMFDSFSSLRSSGTISPKPSPQTTGRKSFFRRFSVSQREEEPIFPMSVTRKQLCDIISNQKQCNRLVSQLLKEGKNAYSNKVSFLSAMEQYEQARTRSDRKTQAVNIMSMFIENGSMFELKQVAEETKKELLIVKNHTKLNKLKESILDILLRDETIATFIMENSDSDSDED